MAIIKKQQRKYNPAIESRLTTPMVDSIASDWLTKQEAARVLKVSTRTVNRWMEDGTLGVSRITARTIRFRATDVEKLREGRTSATNISGGSNGK